jgi:hypothetical protein
MTPMLGGKDPLYQKILAHLPEGSGPEHYSTSLEVTEVEPGKKCCCG